MTSSQSGEDGGSRISERLTGLRERTFAPFAFRDFRILWFAIFVRSGSLWLEQVARPVLIVELTGSALLLGVALAAWMGPNLILSPLAGVIIDRYPKRLVIGGSLVTNIVGSGVLFVLLLFDRAEAWQVLVLAAVSGLTLGFFHPARRAMLPALVPQSALRSAVALSQTGQTVMRIGGAMLAGLLLAFADFTWIFGLITALYAAAALCVTLIRTRADSYDGRARPSVDPASDDGWRPLGRWRALAACGARALRVHVRLPDSVSRRVRAADGD